MVVHVAFVLGLELSQFCFLLGGQLGTRENVMIKRMDHVLMVDDDVELCALVQEYLTAEGFSLKAVHDGEKGLQQALTNEYSLVVLDVMLPGMNGFEVPRRIRSVSKIPVLLLPARGEDVDRIVGLEIGADDYLPKPFNPRELVAVGPKAVVAVTSAAKADIEAASIAALKRCATPKQMLAQNKSCPKTRADPKRAASKQCYFASDSGPASESGSPMRPLSARRASGVSDFSQSLKSKYNG